MILVIFCKEKKRKFNEILLIKDIRARMRGGARASVKERYTDTHTHTRTLSLSLPPSLPLPEIGAFIFVSCILREHGET